MTAVLIGVSVAAGAFAQAVTGIGLALVAGPVLILFLGPLEGVRVALLISLAFNVSYLVPRWRGVQLGEATRLLVPGALATVPASQAFKAIDTRLAALVAGAAILLSVGVVARGYSSPWLATKRGAVVAGAVSGGMNALSANAGPVAVLYGRNANWPVAATAPTLQAYFTALNLVTIPAIGLPQGSTVLPAAAVGMAVGLVAGLATAPRLPAAAIRQVTLLLAGAGGVATLVAAIT